MSQVVEGHVSAPLSRGRLLLILLGGFAVAGAITVCAVLPAEFHLDPSGLGRTMGLMALSAPPEAKAVGGAPAAGLVNAPAALARDYDHPYRTDVIDIPLKGAGDDGSELEYKVHMKAGESMVYSWSVAAPPEEFYYDFHSEQRPSAKEHVISHKSGLGVSGNGALIAPFEGIHGWYLQNQSIKPVIVHLKISGFYDLLTGGRPPA